jgi:hypothetical protein
MVGKRQRIDRAIAPAAIHSGAQEVIEKVVPRCDRVEHVRDARGRFV